MHCFFNSNHMNKEPQECGQTPVKVYCVHLVGTIVCDNGTILLGDTPYYYTSYMNLLLAKICMCVYACTVQDLHEHQSGGCSTPVSYNLSIWLITCLRCTLGPVSSRLIGCLLCTYVGTHIHTYVHTVRTYVCMLSIGSESNDGCLVLSHL